MRIPASMTLAAALASAAVPTGTVAQNSATTTTLTVWVEGTGQADLAERINARHIEMAAKSFRFADLELYTEKGSVRGALVTYVRGSP